MIGIIWKVSLGLLDKFRCFMFFKFVKMFLFRFIGILSLLLFNWRLESFYSFLKVLFKICFILLYERFKKVKLEGRVDFRGKYVNLLWLRLMLVMFG